MRKLLALISVIILCGSCGDSLTPAEGEAVLWLRERAKVPESFEIREITSHEDIDTMEPDRDTTYFYKGEKVYGYDIKTDRHNNPYKHYPDFLSYDSIFVKVTNYDNVKYTYVVVDYTGKSAMGAERQGSEAVVICECGVRGDMLDFVHHRKDVHSSEMNVELKLKKPMRMKNPHPSGDFAF